MVLKTRPVCVPEVALDSRVPARTRHHDATAARHRRVLTVTAMISAAINVFFGIQGLFVGQDVWWIAVLNLVSAAVFLMIPLLYRFGDLVAPLAFYCRRVCLAHRGVLAPWHRLGDAVLLPCRRDADRAGVSASTTSSLPRCLAAVGATTVSHSSCSCPMTLGYNRIGRSGWTFVLTVASAWILVVAVVWYAMREIRRARLAMEAEYERSERLLANILPATIAERLKDPSRNIIADKYDDASILFADIAGYTKRASDTLAERAGPVS